MLPTEDRLWQASSLSLIRDRQDSRLRSISIGVSYLRANYQGSETGEEAMLKTRLCDVLGIEVPIILAPMGTCTSAELAAAVSNAGGLGGIGTLFRATAAIKRDIDVMRTLTSRPF